MREIFAVSLHGVSKGRQTSTRNILRALSVPSLLLLLLCSFFLLSCFAAPSDEELRQGVPADLTTFTNWVHYLERNEFFNGARSGTPKYGQKLKKARSLWADVLEDRKTATIFMPPASVTLVPDEVTPLENPEAPKAQQQAEANLAESESSAQPQSEPMPLEQTILSDTELEAPQLQNEQTEQQDAPELLSSLFDEKPPEKKSKHKEKKEAVDQPQKQEQKLKRHRKVEARRPPITSNIDSSSLSQSEKSNDTKVQREAISPKRGDNPHLYPPGSDEKQKKEQQQQLLQEKKSSVEQAYYGRTRALRPEEFESRCGWYVNDQKYESIREQVYLQEDTSMFQAEQPYALPEEQMQLIKQKRNEEIVLQLLEKRKTTEAALAQIEKDLAAAQATTPTVDYSCSWQFSHYSPSDWEVMWATHITDIDYNQGICSRLRTQEELERSVYMLKRIEEFTYRENNEKNRQVRNTIGEPYDMDLPDNMRSSYRARPIAIHQNVAPPSLSASRELLQHKGVGDASAAATNPQRPDAAGRQLLYAYDNLEDDTPEPISTVGWADFGVDAVNPLTPLQIGTIEYVRDVADQLFSRMNYDLICRAGGGAYEPNWASSAKSAVFTVAKGFDFIEPLIGLLRDPLTMCPKPRHVPLHLREFLDTSAYGDVQSKRHLLMQAATPFQITMRPVSPTSAADIDGILPPWYTESIAHQIRTAIEAVASGSGLPPWAHRHSYPIPHSSQSGSENTNAPRFRSDPLQPSYPRKVNIPPNVPASQILARPQVRQSARSEDEEHTAIIVNNKGEVNVPAALTIDNYFSNPLSRRRSRSAPRVLLFDLGASYFAGWKNAINALGSAWFYQQLAQKGLTIDRVYAWEYETLDPVVEWKSIPAELYSEFSFINTGVTSDPSQNTNPWNTLLEVARPIDYVIVKLDIDSNWIEGPLMEQLLNTPNIQMLIDEMFFEHHVDVQEMRSSWGLGLPEKMGDTYDWVTVLRQTGIRMHSWP